MKFKTKGSMILISLLFILILSIGMTSASEDIDADSSYQSDSIELDDISNDVNDVSQDLSYQNKDKTVLSDGDGDFAGDDDEIDDGDDEITDPDIWADFSISTPNGTNFVEGEEITVNISFNDVNEVIDTYESDELYLNVYNDDATIDNYYHLEIADSFASLTIPEYLPPGEYQIGFGEYETDDDTGEYVYDENKNRIFITSDKILWEGEIGFIIETNYNKIVNADLTIGYSIVELEDLVEGDSITANVNLIDEFNNLMNEVVDLALYIDGEVGPTAGIHVIDGWGTPWTFENLEIGNYSLIIEQIMGESGNYTNIQYNPINFTVKSNIDEDAYSIQLDCEDETFLGNTYELGIRLLDPYYDEVESNVDLYINGSKKATLVLDYGESSYSYHTIKGLSAGPNNITVLYQVRDGVNVSSSAIIIGYENEPYIYIEALDIVVGESASIKTNLTYEEGDMEKLINESYTVIVKNYVDDEDEVSEPYYSEFTIKGNGTKTLSGLKEGSYYVTATYSGNNYKYLPCSSESYFEVFAKETEIDALTRAYSTEEDAIIGIELSDKTGKAIKGLVNVLIDGKKSYKINTSDDIENPVQLNVGKLGYGIHNISLSYAGDKTSGWLASNHSEELIAVYPSYIEIESGDVESDSDLTVNISMTSVNGRKLNETIFVIIYNSNGEDLIRKNYALKNGRASIPLENITEDYIIYAYYPGLDSSIDEMDPNETYYMTSNCYGFIRIVEESGNDNIGAPDLELTKVNDNTVIFSLKDSDSKAIANANITIKLNGNTISKTTDRNGLANITVNGNASIKASYTDANNLTAKGSLEIIVINNVTEKTVYVNQTVEVPVEVEKIVYVNNTIEKNNTVYVNVTPNRTKTVIEYHNMTTTAIAKADGRIGEYFIVRLTDDKGNAIANKEVKIGFNGRVYNKTSDKDGYAKLQINLGYKGTYTFAIGFLGDDNYTGAFEVASIKVNLQTPKLTTSSKTYKASAKTKSLSATFKTAHGYAVSGKTIKFTVNGKTYSAKTNAKGVATVNVSLSKKGTYSFTAKYAGDSQFATVSKSGKLTIK